MSPAPNPFDGCARRELRAEFKENVPATTLYLHQADVLLCAPRVGSGMQVKVLDAVVTSAEGMEGIPVIDGVQPASVRTTRS